MKSGHRRDLWLPAAVGLLVALVSVTAWGVLVAERRDVLLEATREAATATREAVELGTGHQVDTLLGLGELWSNFGLRPLPEWTANVDRAVDRVPGLTAVVWVGHDGARKRVAVGREPARGRIEVDPAEAVSVPLEDPELVGPERDASGAVGYRILLPVETRNGHAGVLVAQFQVAPFLRTALRAHEPGYAITVFWAGEQIFSRGIPSADPWQRWWLVEHEIALPFGGHWRVAHRPTPEFAAARLSPIPHYLLAAGIVLAIVLAVATYQLRVIVRQARFLAASNRALEEHGLELESKVVERTEALEDAVAELEAFNFSVSHDLRTPLAAILNFTAILEEDYRERPLDAEGLAILSRIRRSASRATVLLEDLLQLSRAGRAALTPERVDMTALARETFAQARAAEDATNAEFVVESLPEVMGDRTLLGDVFANLFSNALKYSRGREKPHISVRGRAEQAECIYEVADNGQGFDMRFVDKLFGLFERLHSTEDIEGTGVGLAMVARIVKRHGGRVWAEGRPGEGARFFFAIPRKEPS